MHVQTLTKLIVRSRTVDLSLNPFVAEIAGAKLMQALGIGAPSEFHIVDADGAVEAGTEYIVKALRDGRLGWWGGVPSERNLLVRKIPGTTSLYDLREVLGIGGKPIAFDGEQLFAELKGADLNKLMTASRKAYVLSGPILGFVLPDDLRSIKKAIAWDSPQMLRIHAARLFFSCTAAHSGNVLCDAEARLYSIDHANTSLTNSEEIRLLFQDIRRGTAAWQALADVATLNERALESVFEGFGDLPHVGTVIAYYRERLRLWKSLFN